VTEPRERPESRQIDRLNNNDTYRFCKAKEAEANADRGRPSPV
jgi:hypothetical protein